MKDSAEERAIIIAAFVTSFYAIGAGAPIKIWPASRTYHFSEDTVVHLLT